ncbi:MAG: PotD/PotF family extracellular solute-binding protein [Pikeienuella sp.]
MGDPFQAVHDVSFAVALITDSPGGFAKLATGGYRDVDIVSSDLPWVQRMGPAGFCRYLDEADFAEEYAGFYPEFQTPFEPLLHDGQITGMPTRWGWVGPSVNTDFDKVENWRSYAPVFDASYKDKICLLDWGEWPILPLMLHAGINPWEELDDAALDEARKVIRAALANTRAIVGDLSIAQRGLLDGSLYGLIGGGTYSALALRARGHLNIAAPIPEPQNGMKQGVIWMEATGLVDNGDNPELAKTFIKHLLKPEIALNLAVTESTSNLVPTRAVESLMTEEQRTALLVDQIPTAWERSNFLRLVPNVDDLLAIWGDELAAR